MTTPKDQIIAYAHTHESFQSGELVELLGISRQAVTAHLRGLVAKGSLVKEGKGRGVSYRLNQKAQSKVFAKRYKIKDLSEDTVYRELEMRLALKSSLKKNIREITAYAFTEMVNNAIDHSRSKHVDVKLELSKQRLTFLVEDAGIGCFKNVKDTFALKDMFGAVEHLTKGKQTTMPERHSGQGIFFTSKVASEFKLRANGLELIFDNRIEDVILNDAPTAASGTTVEFTIDRNAKTNLREVFDSYTNADYEFHKTKVYIKLSKRENEHISRSQAKRLLVGLDSFSHIVLDFKGVQGIGQGFADEIFRIYQRAHPDTKIETVNANSAVTFMIERSIPSPS